MEGYDNPLSEYLMEEIGFEPSGKHPFKDALETVAKALDGELSDPEIFYGTEAGIIVYPHDESAFIGYIPRDYHHDLENLGIRTPLGKVEDVVKVSYLEEAYKAVNDFSEKGMENYRFSKELEFN